MHVSGHASQEELKLMLALMKPKYFIPIHGEYRMLCQHRALAEAVGIDSDRVFIVKNGEAVDIRGGVASRHRDVPSGNTLVDGLGIGDVGNIVLRDRKHLSEDGILVIVITLSRSESKIVSGPDTISRGFVYVRESEGLLEEANRIAEAALGKLLQHKANQWALYKQAIREEVGNFLWNRTKRRPMILPILIQV
jgi:ribonuclease J